MNGLKCLFVWMLDEKEIVYVGELNSLYPWLEIYLRLTSHLHEVYKINTSIEHRPPLFPPTMA